MRKIYFALLLSPGLHAASASSHNLTADIVMPTYAYGLPKTSLDYDSAQTLARELTCYLPLVENATVEAVEEIKANTKARRKEHDAYINHLNDCISKRGGLARSKIEPFKSAREKEGLVLTPQSLIRFIFETNSVIEYPLPDNLIKFFACTNRYTEIRGCDYATTESALIWTQYLIARVNLNNGGFYACVHRAAPFSFEQTEPSIKNLYSDGNKLCITYFTQRKTFAHYQTEDELKRSLTPRQYALLLKALPSWRDSKPYIPTQEEQETFANLPESITQHRTVTKQDNIWFDNSLFVDTQALAAYIGEPHNEAFISDVGDLVDFVFANKFQWDFSHQDDTTGRTYFGVFPYPTVGEPRLFKEFYCRGSKWKPL